MRDHTSILSEIDSALAKGSKQHQARMLQAVTDLFVSSGTGLSEQDVALFDDMITRLADKIELSARALLAQRLAPLTKAPQNAINMLANDDEITVASPILLHSELLDDPTLVRIARGKTQEHMIAIAQRRKLGPEVTDILVTRGNRQVVLSAAKNPGARFSESGFSWLVKRSEDDDVLTECVGSRPDIPLPLFQALLEKASDLVRKRLSAEARYTRDHIDRAVASIASGINDQARMARYGAATRAVEFAFKSSQSRDALIRTFAEESKHEEAVVALANVCQLPVEAVETAITLDRSEALIVLGKGAKLSWPTVKALLTLRAGQRTPSSTEIDRALASFERLSAETALRIIDFYKIRNKGHVRQ
jgi:uncharacterized protein (DUF2336 family)